MNNGAVRCGDLICRPITGLFSKNPLPSGYMHGNYWAKNVYEFLHFFFF